MAGSEFSRASTFASKRPNTEHLKLPLVGDSVSWDIINGYTRHSKSVSDTSSDWTLTRASEYPFSNSSSPDLKVNGRRFAAVPPLNVHTRTSPASTDSESAPVLLLKLQKRKKLHKSMMDIGDEGHRRKFSFRLSTPKSLGRIWGRLTGKGKEEDDGTMDFDAPERIAVSPAMVPQLTRTRTRTERYPRERTGSLYRSGSTSTSTPDLSLKRSQSERRPPPVPRRPLPRRDEPPLPITLSSTSMPLYDLRNAQASAPSLPIMPHSRKSSLQNLKANDAAAARGHNRSHSHAVSIRSAASEEANSNVRVGAGLQRSKSAVTARRPAGRESSSSAGSSNSVFLAFPPPKYQRGRVPPFPLSRTGSRSGTHSTVSSVQSYF